MEVTTGGDAGMMDQFYTSHHAGGVTYLCIRDNNNPWYGYAIRRLDKEPNVKYYIILLKNGKVVEISSFDEEEARNRVEERLRSQICEWNNYDEVQTLNEVT